MTDIKVFVVRMQGLPYRASEDDIVSIPTLSPSSLSLSLSLRFTYSSAQTTVLCSYTG